MDWRPFMLVASAIAIVVVGIVIGLIVKNRRRRILIGVGTCLLALVASVTAWHLPELPGESTRLVTESAAGNLAGATSRTTAPFEGPSTQVLAGTPPELSGYAAQFRDAENYRDFVNKLRPAAEAGDADAQIHLFKALRYCWGEYRVYFLMRGRYRTLEEGVARATISPALSPDQARLVHARCHELFESNDPDLEGHAKWMERAANLGQPLARALVASHLLLNKRVEDPADPENDIADPEAERQAARLFGSALRSRDPEVMIQVGDHFHLFSGQNEDQKLGFGAWYLAACMRGLDCSPSGELAGMMCRGDRACQPYETVQDHLRRWVSAQYDEMEVRAREINALIDAGRWEELGFAATVEDDRAP